MVSGPQIAKFLNRWKEKYYKFENKHIQMRRLPSYHKKRDKNRLSYSRESKAFLCNHVAIKECTKNIAL